MLSQFQALLVPDWPIQHGDNFGSSRIATFTTASGDEVMEMENRIRTRMGKRPNMADILDACG